MYTSNYEMGFGGSLTPAVKKLLIINGAVFILQFFGLVSYSVFGLVPASVVQKGMIWQFVTYMFMHGGWFHLFINMFVLWMFGSEMERHWGSREFYKYYFVTGIGAGIISVIFDYGSSNPIVGASGAIYGLLLAFGIMFPNRPVFLYFLFPVKAKYFVLIFGAIAFVSAISATSDGIAHFTHLGGMIVGFLYLRLDWRIHQFWSRISDSKRRSPNMKIHKKPDQDMDNFKDRIDEILDKINDVGYHNLTDEEKNILKRASKYYLDRDN